MITVENISKSFATSPRQPPATALREVGLTVDAGALYGILGPREAGKTTLARCLALRERPDRGTVRYDGVDTGRLEGRRLWATQREVGIVDPRLRTERTVAGNVAEPLERMGMDGSRRRGRVAELLDLVGLSRAGAQSPGELTEGQRRRVAVARALGTRPAVLVADDPTDGVDSADTGAVLGVLDRARAELGATVVLTTREAGVARRVCDELALLDRGELVDSGTVLGALGRADSRIAEALLPPVDTPRGALADHDRAADVVLIGFAAVGALLPETADRFDVELATLGGGVTRVGDTPVARFRLGVTGRRADAALAWLSERGAHVTRPFYGLHSVAA